MKYFLLILNLFLVVMVLLLMQNAPLRKVTLEVHKGNECLMCGREWYIQEVKQADLWKDYGTKKESK